MGTTVISGSGIAIVIRTGKNTQYERIAHDLQLTNNKTSFELGIKSVSILLLRYMLVMAPIVFIINGITKGNWLDAFLFAITIAVGLTPEMLPMVVTANLVKGSVKMSKEGTIIKNINSIRDLGAMDILCTDKTGLRNVMDHAIIESA